jgi:hypothetical protein
MLEPAEDPDGVADAARGQVMRHLERIHGCLDEIAERLDRVARLMGPNPVSSEPQIPPRERILAALEGAGADGMTLDALAEALERNRSSISRIVNDLEHEGLLRYRKWGRTKFWMLASAADDAGRWWERQSAARNRPAPERDDTFLELWEAMRPVAP